METTSLGDLIFWNESTDKPKGPTQNLALTRGSWLAFYAASVIDGAAIAVEHWKGEVDRSAG